jgi:hypothetical protein
MGNCQRELGPQPPPVPNWRDHLDSWRPIFEAEKEVQIWRALRERAEKVCSSRALNFCSNEFFGELMVELPKCGPEFYKLCDFDRLIRICPFDPAWDAFEWKEQLVTERLQALEVEVKELQATLPTRK